MKKTTIMTLTLVGLLLFPANLLGDAQKGEWFGNWSMNHDGFAGTLSITQTQADCVSPAWCDMAISYVDNKGVKHAGSIEKIEAKGQHMIFYTNLPGNRQKFDAYIISGGQLKMAGATNRGRRKFGFYATKK